MFLQNLMITEMNANGEVTQAKWFNHNTIPDDLSDNPKDAIKDYYKKYFNIDLEFAE